MEIFGWTTVASKVFKQFPTAFFKIAKHSPPTKALYNGFLAAGLLWSLTIADPKWQYNIGLFFLACIAIAGRFGMATVTRKIFFIQTLPAIITIILQLSHWK